MCETNGEAQWSKPEDSVAVTVVNIKGGSRPTQLHHRCVMKQAVLDASVDNLAKVDTHGSKDLVFIVILTECEPLK